MHIRKKEKREKLGTPLICFLIKASPISTNRGSDGSRRYVQHQRGSLSTVFLEAIYTETLKKVNISRDEALKLTKEGLIQNIRNKSKTCQLLKKHYTRGKNLHLGLTKSCNHVMDAKRK